MSERLVLQFRTAGNSRKEVCEAVFDGKKFVIRVPSIGDSQDSVEGLSYVALTETDPATNRVRVILRWALIPELSRLLVQDSGKKMVLRLALAEVGIHFEFAWAARANGESSRINVLGLFRIRDGKQVLERMDWTDLVNKNRPISGHMKEVNRKTNERITLYFKFKYDFVPVGFLLRASGHATDWNGEKIKVTEGGNTFDAYPVAKLLFTRDNASGEWSTNVEFVRIHSEHGEAAFHYQGSSRSCLPITLDLPKTVGGLLPHQASVVFRTRESDSEVVVSFRLQGTLSVVRLWNSIVAVSLSAHIEAIRGDRPLSFAPRLSDDALDFSQGCEVGFVISRGRESVEFIALKDSGVKSTRLAFPVVTTIDGEILHCDFELSYPTEVGQASREDITSDGGVERESLRFELGLRRVSRGGTEEQEISGAPALRVGALDITLASAPLTGDSGYLRLGSARPERREQRYPFTLEFMFGFGVAEVAPGAEDVPELEDLVDDYRRGSPLLIPISHERGGASSGGAWNGVEDGETPPLSLVVRETVLEGERQQIKIELASQGGPLLGQKVVVLDAEPFFVGRVDLPRLTPTADSNRLAVWQSDSVEGAQWQITSALGAHYPVVLPPQSIGEATVKLRRDASPVDVEEGKPIDFRFAPPSVVEVFTTWRRGLRGWVEIPSNLRRIFGDASQRAPGAPVHRVVTEILYGLGLKIEGRTDLLLSELTADLGLPPAHVLPGQESGAPGGWSTHLLPHGRISSTGDGGQRTAFVESFVTFAQYRNEWRALLETFQRRLMVLSLHLAGQAGAREFNTGLEFTLRRNAQVRAPVALLPEGQRHAPYANDGSRGGQIGAQLLPGGAEWGFESANIYDQVWARPTTKEGGIADLHFSALGAWGSQRAVFDDGLTTITSHVVMGRTAYYSLKRIGRIGVLWNRAEHVIVYERTVVPSSQFAGTQADHLGRPLLRKTQEYVDILEEYRGYPEDGRSLRERGFVEGARFRSRRISVESAWGRDLEGGGWVVPLWNPGAEPEIYPLPQCDLSLSPAAESGSSPIFAELTRPEGLVFYTPTGNEAGRDTDAWPAVEGVDFIDMPAPLPPEIGTHDAGNPDAILPDDVQIPAGYAAVTFPVRIPGDRGVALSKDRSERAVVAKVRNVTLSRSRGIAESTGDTAKSLHKTRRDLAAVANEVSRELGELRGELERYGNGIDKLDENLKKAISVSVTRISGKIIERIGSLKSSELEKGLLASACDRLAEQIARGLDSAKSNLGVELRKEIERVRGDLLALRGDLDHFKGQALTVVEASRAHFLSVTSRLGDSLSELRAGVLGASFQRAVGLPLAAQLRDALRRALAVPDEAVLEIRRVALEGLETIGLRFGALVEPLLKRLSSVAPAAASKLTVELQRVRAEVVRAVEEEWAAIHQASDGLKLLIKASVERLVGAEAPAEPPGGSIGASCGSLDNWLDREIVGKLGDILNAAATEVESQRLKVATVFDGIKGKISGGSNTDEIIKSVVKALEARVRQCEEDVGTLGKKLTDPCRESDNAYLRSGLRFQPETLPLVSQLNATVSDNLLSALCKELFGTLPDLSGLKELVRSILETVENVLDPGVFLHRVRASAATATAEIEGLLETVGEGFAEYARRLRANGTVGLVAQAPSRALGLLRAFGDAPIVQGLEFNRQRLGYYFEAASAAIRTTPVAALFERGGRGLKALGLRLPTREIIDRVVPDLRDLDLRTLFPDFGGIKLEDLIPGLRVDAMQSGRLRVRHGIDPGTRVAFAEIAINGLEVANTVNVFSIGGCGLTVRDGRFTADVRLDIGVDGRIEKRTKASIDGTWELRFAGEVFVTFPDTPLRYANDTGLEFALDPRRVRLGPRLDFLSKFLASFGSSGQGGGFRLVPLYEGSLPAGLRSELVLALPPLQAGTFGITGLTFAAALELRFLPQFSIGTAFGLGSKRDPFTITVFVLGGGGWLESRANYVPARQATTAVVSIGIGASAMIGINLVVVRGSIRLFFGVNAEFSLSGGARRLGITIILLAEGTVTVLGLISVGLTLMLEVTVADGVVTGRGTMSFTIKLFFFKKTIRASVEMRLAGRKRNSNDSVRMESSGSSPSAGTLYLRSLN